ncbi:MAG: lipoprotein [Bacteroidetes bacterium]|nr:lipoprotein [Bacteroidota bacterium]
MRKLLLLLLITLIVTSCSKESDNVSTLHTVSPSISGITMRDMNGNLIGTVDAFDWNANDLFRE